MNSTKNAFAKDIPISGRKANNIQYKLKKDSILSPYNQMEEQSQTVKIAFSPRGELVEGNLVLNNARVYNVFEEVSSKPEHNLTKQIQLLQSSKIKNNNEY